MRARSLVPVGLFVVGGALVTVAVLAGRATASLVVILPVLSGSSVEFLLGVACLIAGFLALPFAGIGAIDPSPPPADEATEDPMSTEPEFGGIILIGPLPVFFGAWRDVPTRTRYAAMVAGALLLLALVVIVLWY